MEKETEPKTAPTIQKMERMQTLKLEHKQALARAVTLDIPHADALTDEVAKIKEDGSLLDESQEVVLSKNKHTGKTSWNELVEKLFNRSESGHLVLKKEAEALK